MSIDLRDAYWKVLINGFAPNAHPLIAGTIRPDKGPDIKLESNTGVFNYGKSFKISEPKISRIPRQTCRLVFTKGKQ